MTLVVDNSTTAAARYQLATELRDLACRCQTQLLLFTREARERLASAISSANTTAGEAARFALLSTRPGTTDVGAVRNFINLITLGQRVISIDDDIAGPVLRTSCADVTWGSGAQCVPITPLSESNCNHWSRCSLVDAHLELLGQAVGPASSPILLTVSGLRGDCGAENPWRELSGSDVQSPRARLTRQVLRGVAQPMVTPIDGLMTYAWGFVNDGHLPPFMPIGRNQDGAFAAMLRSFRPNALMCHLPVYVTHRPSARRSERRYRDVPAALVRRWRTNDFLASLSHSVPKQRCGRTVNARMSDVLTRVGSEISAGEFATLIEMWIRRQRFHLSAAERWARRSGWRERRRVLRAIERCRTWQFTNEAVIPAEWTHTADLGRYLQNAAKTIARWPELVDVMNHLPRWTRPWADLGESDGVLDLGAA
jgi:hypothetical protein